MSTKMTTMDGNTAAAHVAYAFTEVAAIYPITPSSPMAGSTDEWSARGRKNMFGQRVKLVEMQSEAGAVAAVHGAAQTGCLAASYTSSQGLMLMIPVLYRIAGERLPVVIHVAARTVGTHAMSIFGDHSDVMACRQTGFAMLSSGSVQEAADMAGIAHLSALRGGIPFMHFFDGFRTSHEISKISLPDEEKLTAMLDKDALAAFRTHALNPEHPMLRNTVQNGDVYFQVRECANRFYDALPDVVEDYMKQFADDFGREYHIFDYYGHPEATELVVAMGSVSGTAMEAVDYLNARGRKVGFLQVRLYRPFAVEKFLEAVPKSVRSIAVLDRCKEPGAAGEPLFEDVRTAFYGSGRDVTVVGGRYGLSSKDTDPSQIVAAFNNLLAEKPINGFTIGINDDVTHLSLPCEPLEGFESSAVCCKFWGLGGDGTVGANHNTVKIIAGNTEKYAQAYFEYDAKKSYGVTKSHLRFSEKPIRGSYYVKSADFIAVHVPAYIKDYDIVSELREGGTLLVNCPWDAAEAEKQIPAGVLKTLAEKRARLFTIDASAIAHSLGLGNRTNTVLQAAFFALSGIIDLDAAAGLMKDAARQAYGAKGDDIVAVNCAAIDAGMSSAVEIPVRAEWTALEPELPADESALPDAVRNILLPINRQKGDDLPVSAFIGREDGAIEMGMTAWEKRGIATWLPRWDAQKCIQCNRCALVCPHAAIRPYLLSDDEAANAPEGFDCVPAKGREGAEYSYSLQLSNFDCTGCGSCVNSCPAKALELVPAKMDESDKARWNYGLSLSDKGDVYSPATIKGVQFRQPLVEFSAACAGCGETPYAKLMTQLFGDRVYWANGTGCSQAWGSPMPGIPYTVNKRGHGVAWTNSLFENNAELALGMFLSVRQQREAQKARIEALVASELPADVRAAAEKWLDNYEDFDASRKASDELIEALESFGGKKAEEILAFRDQLAKKTFWMYGGDGWAYDIGFGGLDHVIASGENINVFVIDTEVYSNTGGQSSKATPIGAVAQFASAGKRSRKKDLGAMMMTYGNVYVAQVAMGADPNQLLKALREAESYPGPSVIVAYTPCSAHGIRLGMGKTQEEMKRAVESGYWNLYRYDPRKNEPLTIDSKAPSMDFMDFLSGETRYASLRRSFPDAADELFAIGKEDAAKRWEKYKKMEENQKK